MDNTSTPRKLYLDLVISDYRLKPFQRPEYLALSSQLIELAQRHGCRTEITSSFVDFFGHLPEEECYSLVQKAVTSRSITSCQMRHCL